MLDTFPSDFDVDGRPEQCSSSTSSLSFLKACHLKTVLRTKHHLHMLRKHFKYLWSNFLEFDAKFDGVNIDRYLPAFDALSKHKFIKNTAPIGATYCSCLFMILLSLLVPTILQCNVATWRVKSSFSLLLR